VGVGVGVDVAVGVGLGVAVGVGVEVGVAVGIRVAVGVGDGVTVGVGVGGSPTPGKKPHAIETMTRKVTPTTMQVLDEVLISIIAFSLISWCVMKPRRLATYHF
jgi:hypothetical protein